MRCSSLLVGLSALVLGVSAGSPSTFCDTKNDVCVTGTLISETKIQYELNTTRTASEVGWIAVGLGPDMTHSEMAVTWPNADGTITVSHRRATKHSQPDIIHDDPHFSVVGRADLSLLTGPTTRIVVEVTQDKGVPVDHIYAFSPTRPNSPSPDTLIAKHAFTGKFQLSLSDDDNDE